MPSHCLVLLTDSLYLSGTLRTIESWQALNPALSTIILSKEPSILQDPRLRELADQFILIETAAYEGIRPYKKSRSKRHAQTFYKFEAFRDFGFERNIFLDSDVLCLRPTPLLLESSPHALLAAIDTGFKKTRGYKGHANEINSGVLSIHHSLQGHGTVEQLKTLARETPGRSGYNSGDQGIINKWIHRQGIDLGLLPSEYNVIKKDYADTSGLADCRLLHYCHRKPWIIPSQSPSPLESLWHER